MQAQPSREERDEIASMFRQMASKGTAPNRGCNLFSVGYEDYFERLSREYLKKGFKRLWSSEKFIVGSYGSGKTHFLRHLQFIAEGLTCVTSEVKLSKDIDFTRYLSVFREVARTITPPGSKQSGIPALLRCATQRICLKHGNATGQDQLEVVSQWCHSQDEHQFAYPDFARALKRALLALSKQDLAAFDRLCRWLSGEFGNRSLSRELDLPTVEKADQNRAAGTALFTLGQFNRRAHFRGTVIAFDEAEQGLDLDRKRFGVILSMLQSTINSLADLDNGALFILYAFTPDLLERFQEFPALQQRIISSRSFLEGNTFAPVIPLDRGGQVTGDLELIAKRLCDLYFQYFDLETEEMATVRADCLSIATAIATQSASITSRRQMVKAVCERLLSASLDPLAAEDDDDEDDF